MIADAYTKRRDWENKVLVWSGWGSAQPVTRTPQEAVSPARETTQEQVTVYLPPTVGIESMDRLTVDGVEYETIAEPWHWHHGSLAHITARVRKVNR